MDRTTIGVIGLGPVGSILAAHLIRDGVDVVVEDVAKKLLVRIKKDGLRVSGIKQLAVRVNKAVGSLAELVEFKPTIVFIATKACFLKSVLAELKSVRTNGMKVVSFQNGFNNEHLVAEILGIDNAYRVVINYAGNLIGPGNIRMNWFQPPNYVGAFRKGLYETDETTKYIADMLTTCGLPTEEVSNIRRHVWEKTILNSALCSVCALTGQTMKEAMKLQPTRDLAVKVLEEGLAVAKADGYDFGEDALDRFTSYLEKGGAHKPSMLIDVENKRKTEVDFLSGAISDHGKKCGVLTPANDLLSRLLKGLESAYSKTH